MTEDAVRAGRRRSRSFSFKKVAQNYSLSSVLALLFIASWILMAITGWQEFSSEQEQHGHVPMVFGEDGYVWRFFADTFQNWQSEFLQLTTFVLLTVWLIHKDSPESRDSSDRMERKIDEIKRGLEQLKSKQ